MSDCASADAIDCVTMEGCILLSNGSCTCDTGYGSAKGDGSDCAACENNTFKHGTGTGNCSQCNVSDTVATARPGSNANSYCKCTNDTHGIFNSNCQQCNSTGQVISDTNGSCICGKGFTQNNTDASCTAPCNETGQMPVNNYSCQCKEGHGTTSTKAEADIVCDPCQRNSYNNQSGIVKCKICDSGYIGVNVSESTNSTFTGPNIKCVSAGTCENSICSSQNLCSTAFCTLYGPGCLYIKNQSKCMCDETLNVIADKDGNCISTVQGKANEVPLYIIITPIVVILAIVMGSIGIAIYLKHKTKYPERPKQPAWKVAPPIEYVPMPGHQYNEDK